MYCTCLHVYIMTDGEFFLKMDWSFVLLSIFGCWFEVDTLYLFKPIHAVSRARPAFRGLVVHMVQLSHRPARDYKKTSSL